jgi:hypothetical protein
MVHKGKRGFQAVSFEICDDTRAALLRTTGEKTLTAAVHEALVAVVLWEQQQGPLRRRRELERRWVSEAGLGRSRDWEDR